MEPISSGCATPGRATANALACKNTFTLAVALAVKSGNNEIIYQDILTALADETNDLSMPCHDQRAGLVATVRDSCLRQISMTSL